MFGYIYKLSSSRTKIRDLIEYLLDKKSSENKLYKYESLFSLCGACLTSKPKFIHIFNPTKVEILFIKLASFFNKKVKLIFSFEDEIAYKSVYKVISKNTVLIESNEALEYFKTSSKGPRELFFIRPYVDSNVFVSSGAKQLSIKKEILFIHDSEKNSKAHLVIEMMKYLPNEMFLTCVDDNENLEYQENLKDIASNLKVDWKIKFSNVASYSLDDNISDLFMLLSLDRDPKRKDFYYMCLSQGLLVLSNNMLDEEVNGWFKLESTSSKAMAKQIMELCEDFIEVDAKKALSHISKEAKSQELYDFYINL